MCYFCLFFFFFFNDTATTEIYTLSLHDALPISQNGLNQLGTWVPKLVGALIILVVGYIIARMVGDRKSTRLNSSHVEISYAVFCLKKKKKKKKIKVKKNVNSYITSIHSSMYLHH